MLGAQRHLLTGYALGWVVSQAQALSLPPSSCQTPTELSRDAPRPRQVGRVPGSRPRCRADAPPPKGVPSLGSFCGSGERGAGGSSGDRAAFLPECL